MLPGNGFSILIVENNFTDFSSLAKYLSNRGFSLHVAENGREGLRLFRDTNPDIVITEINLPVLGGIEMLRLIKLV